MKLQLSNLYKWVILLLMVIPTNVFAAGPPKPSDLSNPFAQILIVVIVVLAVCIAILANVLLSAAQYKMKKKMEEDSAALTSGTTLKTIISILLVVTVSAVSAQDAAPLSVANNSDLISGISSNGFYGLMSVVILELIILLALIYNLKFILRKEKATVTVAADEVVPQENKLAKWWDNINKFRPVQEEAAIDLGHDYDGIRELDNRLPPWWLYGFYVCVIFAGIYLWRYHVAKTAPLSKEELAIEMKKGEEAKAAYLKNAANNIDETTVQFLSAEADLTAGKQIFTQACAACHLADGGGSIGPNLTDDYWLHGGSIQDIFKTIKYGVVEKGMKSWKDDYGPMKMAQIASYIKSLKGTKPANPKAPQGDLYTENTTAAKTDSTAVKVDSTKMK